jgi:hypothetical protein
VLKRHIQDSARHEKWLQIFQFAPFCRRYLSSSPVQSGLTQYTSRENSNEPALGIDIRLGCKQFNDCFPLSPKLPAVHHQRNAVVLWTLHDCTNLFNFSITVAVFGRGRFALNRLWQTEVRSQFSVVFLFCKITSFLMENETTRVWTCTCGTALSKIYNPAACHAIQCSHCKRWTCSNCGGNYDQKPGHQNCIAPSIQPIESIPPPDPVKAAGVGSSPQKVIVRNVAGKLLTVDFTADMDVGQLMAGVSNKLELPPESFWMSWAGKPLLAGKTCGTYGFRSGHTLQLVLRQR